MESMILKKSYQNFASPLETIDNIENIDLEKGSVLLVDKPLRWTSFDVVNKLKYEIRKMFDIKKFKIGHAGTLDPLATGLLIVCIGKCTKLIPEIQSQAKEYTGTFTIGATTPSYDLEKQPENFLPFCHITKEDIDKATARLTGVIQQFPPVFSAVKIDGKRAFDYARNKQEVTLQPKETEIYSFEITHTDLPKIDFKIACSKGTYIRSIAHDFGNLLECGAYLSALRRTKTGDFSVEQAMDMTPFVNIEKTTNLNRKKRDFDV
ncbi:MAG: tRNA pseudouridine(55) synthase TruB [Bacteroidales bacterium]|jgi:tRNA pseudouridine55 synthase|nr:tRNA pseudouridine(55) synthase TruB [Bacteroidales bacterium]